MIFLPTWLVGSKLLTSRKPPDRFRVAHTRLKATNTPHTLLFVDINSKLQLPLTSMCYMFIHCLSDESTDFFFFFKSSLNKVSIFDFYGEVWTKVRFLWFFPYFLNLIFHKLIYWKIKCRWDVKKRKKEVQYNFSQH